MQNTANGTEGSAVWNTVDWQCAQQQVNNLRQRIFRASEEGNYRKVRNLQKLMLRSRSNALLAVRRVSQVNRGKDTPGVDKLVAKTPAARAKLVEELSQHQPWRVMRSVERSGCQRFVELRNGGNHESDTESKV